jgi:hypothetical protein
VDRWGRVQTDGSKLRCRPLVYGFERDADFSSSSITIFDVVFVWFEFSDPPSLHISSFFSAGISSLYTNLCFRPSFTASKAGFEHLVACTELSAVSLWQMQG